MGGHLADVTSKEEQEFIVNSLLKGNLVDYMGVWLGGSRQDEKSGWTWITGASFGFTVWGFAEYNPNDGTYPYALNLFRADNKYTYSFGWNDSSVGGDMWRKQNAGLLVEWER